MAKLGDPRWETDVPGKAVWKGKELKVDGVTIPPFSWGLVKVLRLIGVFGFLLRYGPDVLMYICRGISPFVTYYISPGHWYLFREFGKPGVLKAVRFCSSYDAATIVKFLRKPSCMSNVWIMSGTGGAHLIKMVSKKFGSNACDEFEKKSGEEISEIVKVLHSQALQSDKAWPKMSRKSYASAKK